MATTTLSPPEPPKEQPRSQPAEESGLARIAGWCHDHRWWVLDLLAGGPGRDQRRGPGGREQLLQQSHRGQAAGPADPGQGLPRSEGQPAQVVISTTGPVTAASVRNQTAKMVAALTPAGPCRQRWSVPFTGGRGPPDLLRRAHRLCAGGQFDEQAGDLPEDAIKQGRDHGPVLRRARLPRGPRRAGHQPGGRGQARVERGHRHPGRHHHHAAGLRVGRGHGPAHHHRPVRHRHRLRRARPAVPRHHHTRPSPPR